MASSRQWQVGSVIGLCLLASTAACEQNAPTPTIGEPVTQSAPVTSLVTVTTATVSTIPVDLVDDCVEFVQFAAYVGVEDMVTMWDAAGQDIARLRENCISLGRGDPRALEQLSVRRDELEAFLSGTVASTTPG